MAPQEVWASDEHVLLAMSGFGFDDSKEFLSTTIPFQIFDEAVIDGGVGILFWLLLKNRGE